MRATMPCMHNVSIFQRTYSHCLYAFTVNTCTCPNGTPASGAKCVKDGGETCAECNTGWTLNQNSSKCTGTFAHDFSLSAHLDTSIVYRGIKLSVSLGVALHDNPAIGFISNSKFITLDQRAFTMKTNSLCATKPNFCCEWIFSQRM